MKKWLEIGSALALDLAIIAAIAVVIFWTLTHP
jgi:hypothetical protein